MSKILITGTSAPQASAEANERSLSFSKVLSIVLSQQGHTVVQQIPDVSWTLNDLDEYDCVLVGISPLTSLSANYVYGALSVIDVLRDTGRLRLFFDAPDPTKIYASIRAIIKNPENLTKPFYSYRRGYNTILSHNVRTNLLDVISMLLNEQWPVTLYPRLPWTDHAIVQKQLPSGAHDSIVGVNFDSYLISNQTVLDIEKRNKWVVDNHSDRWTKSTIATLSFPTVPMKWNKAWSDAQVFNQISYGIGAILSPSQYGTWWSYRLIQCLNAQTPVVTDWRESGAIGPHWMHLAAFIEDMEQGERDELA